MQPERLMTTPLRIFRTSETAQVDDLGRPLRDEDTYYTTVCRVVRKQSMIPDPNVDGLLVSVQVVYVPLGTPLRESDRVVAGSVTYQILGPVTDVTAPRGGGYRKATIRLVEDAA